jgi:UDP-GlcNAc:undecaprenyl-phosphate GlcNAc-1-phosphate transferase
MTAARGVLRRRRLARAGCLLACFLAALLALTYFAPPRQYYAQADFQISDQIQTRYLRQGVASPAACEAAIREIVDAASRRCPGCVATHQACAERLSSRQRRMLAGEASDTPALRTAGGLVEFRSGEPALAYRACQDYQRADPLPGRDAGLCSAPDAQSLKLAMLAPSGTAYGSWSVIAGKFAAVLALLAAATSFLACFAIVHLARFRARSSLRETGSAPQDFHANPTPRIGGIAIACGLVAAGLCLELRGSSPILSAAFTLLLASALPAFGGGLGEDATRSVGVLARLMLTMAAGALASLLLGASLDRLGLAALDWLLETPVVALAFTAFAVAGIANSINIVDGYNGLAGGFLSLVTLAICWVAYVVGDSFVLAAGAASLGATAGFLAWNWPGGRIFLGDGGAYLLGFWVAELSVLLVVRNNEVSPWFPLALMIYPVFETLFSIFRRTVLRGVSSGMPDALHLHTLVFRRLIRARDRSSADDMRRRNNAVVAYVIPLSLTTVLPAAFLWRSSAWMMSLCAAFCILYWLAYGSIVRFRSGAAQSSR